MVKSEASLEQRWLRRVREQAPYSGIGAHCARHSRLALRTTGQHAVQGTVPSKVVRLVVCCSGWVTAISIFTHDFEKSDCVPTPSLQRLGACADTFSGDLLPLSRLVYRSRCEHLLFR